LLNQADLRKLKAHNMIKLVKLEAQAQEGIYKNAGSTRPFEQAALEKL